MSDGAREALERLERRVAALEGLVRQLLAQSPAALPTRERIGAPVGPVAPRVVVRPRADIGLTPVALPAPAARSDRTIDWEQWVGQRGLLVVGVLALLATGGFFLNYAIQHGWIPPVVRASSAVIAGAALAVWGDRLVRSGMLRYGASIIGGGGGLVYLGIWAAAGPYGLISREIGVLMLAATSGAVVALAVRHALEALAIWALVGAYLAPVFLAGAEPEPAKFLAYMGVIGTTWLLLAERVGWRATFDFALFGFFLLPAVLIPHDLNSTLGVNYGVLGAVVALLATGPSRSAWPEARMGALVMVWTLLFAVSGPDPLRWNALTGGALVTLIVWWQQLRAKPFAGFSENAISADFIVYLTPLALVTLAIVSPPAALRPWGGAVPLALGVIYLGSGWPRRGIHLIVMGFILLLLAVSGQWDRAAVAAGWAILAVAASASGRWARRPGAYEVGAVIALLAFLQLFSIALFTSNTPVFFGPWSLAWYVCLAGFAITARWWDARAERDETVGLALWSMTVATLLIGGSIELVQAFDRSALQASTALVWYWILFAVALVRGAGLWRAARCGAALRAVLLLMGAGYLLLFSFALQSRATDPAFIGLWSVTWYGCCIAAVVATRWWPAGERLPVALRPGRAALWWMAGGCLLLGGSIELHRAFTSELAGDLAISTFWLLYAGALVNAGFRLDRKVVRSAGLGVAALAAMKIVLYDLSALQALYRVGSFFVLALITLAVAYAYNQKARRPETRV